MAILTYVLFLSILGILVLYFYFRNSFKYWELRGVRFKQPSFPFGNVFQLMVGNAQLGGFISQLYKEFEEPYFGIFAFTKPYLVIKDPEIIKRILVKDFQAFPNRFFFCDEKIDPIAGNSLATIKAPDWKTVRAKLSPTFTTGKMRGMMQLMQQCAEGYVKQLETFSDTTVDLTRITLKYTTHVIALCAFGIHFNSSVEHVKTTKKRFERMFTVLTTRLYVLCYFFAHLAVKLFKFQLFDARAAHLAREIFTMAYNDREITKVRRNDFLDILIDLRSKDASDDQYKFSNNDRLLAQATSFIISGFGPGTAVITYTLHELAVNVDIQTRLRKEIEDVIAAHGALTYEAVQDMKYLQMVIHESIRKYPITAFIQRESTVDYTIPETGLVIERGTGIIISQNGLHWDPKYFPNPEKYDPDRFNDENKRMITPCTYLPFGEGPRNCIGKSFGAMTTKIALIYVLRNFKVEVSPKTIHPLIYGSFTLLQPEGGIPLILRKL